MEVEPQPFDDAQVERVARDLASWHGSAYSHQDRDRQMQTIASSFAGHRWAHATDHYADKKWQQYRWAAKYVLAAIAAERDACAKIADRCADDETRKALGANATINASQIANAIRNRTTE